MLNELYVAFSHLRHSTLIYVLQSRLAMGVCVWALHGRVASKAKAFPSRIRPQIGTLLLHPTHQGLPRPLAAPFRQPGKLQRSFAAVGSPSTKVNNGTYQRIARLVH